MDAEERGVCENNRRSGWVVGGGHVCNTLLLVTQPKFKQ